MGVISHWTTMSLLRKWKLEGLQVVLYFYVKLLIILKYSSTNLKIPIVAVLDVLTYTPLIYHLYWWERCELIPP